MNDAQNKSQPSTGARPRVLLIEDDEMLCEVFSGLIEGAFDCDCILDPATAIELRSQEAYELVVTDLKMPTMSGVEVVAAMAKRVPGLRIAIASGLAPNDPSVREALRLGACGHVPKPYPTSPELIELIKQLIKG